MRTNVPPELWGPSAWTFLDYCAAGADPSSPSSFYDFIELLPAVLPCERCREHAAAYLAEKPVRGSEARAWLKAFRQDVEKRKHAGKKPEAGCGCTRGPRNGPPSQGEDCSPFAGSSFSLSAALLTVAVMALVLWLLGQWRFSKRPTHSVPLFGIRYEG